MQNFLDQKMQRSKDAMIKDFKLKILICFNSPITGYRTPYHPISSLFLFQIEQVFGVGI
jgi:hypothetical protein